MEDCTVEILKAELGRINGCSPWLDPWSAGVVGGDGGDVTAGGDSEDGTVLDGGGESPTPAGAARRRKQKVKKKKIYGWICTPEDVRSPIKMRHITPYSVLRSVPNNTELGTAQYRA